VPGRPCCFFRDLDLELAMVESGDGGGGGGGGRDQKAAGLCVELFQVAFRQFVVVDSAALELHPEDFRVMIKTASNVRASCRCTSPFADTRSCPTTSSVSATPSFRSCSSSGSSRRPSLRKCGDRVS
jgi:hypothetical protein